MELSHIHIAVPNPSKYVKKHLLKPTILIRVRVLPILPLGTYFLGTQFSLLISMHIFRYIYQHIYMEIREEKEWENVQQFNTGPPMTILQAKLLALLGQAHDMFSRIFQIRIYESFLPNM